MEGLHFYSEHHGMAFLGDDADPNHCKDAYAGRIENTQQLWLPLEGDVDAGSQHRANTT